MAARAAGLLAVLLLVPALACAAGVERFQVYLRSTQTASADFEQQVFDREKKLVQRSRGSFTLQRPGRFRWSYAQPYAQLIVGDGKRVWIYDEDLNQVTVRAMANALGSTPASSAAGVERAFELSDAGARDGLEWVEAKPREREAGFERIRLGLGTVGVQAMELTDHFGQTTLLRFVNIARNPRVDPDAFRFVPPKGADVLGE